jgi:hypothetical protein
MSRKIGRNDPCPCGSGRKYKKCCLRTGRIPRDMNEFTWTPEQMTVNRLSLMRCGEWLQDNPAFLDELAERLKAVAPHTDLKGHINKLWDSRKVERMATEDILLKLASMGVAVDARTFVNLAKGYVSAIQMAEEQFYTRDVVCDHYDDDFIWVAACELWRRLLPDRPCIEMLDGFDVKDCGRIEAGRLSK